MPSATDVENGSAAGRRHWTDGLVVGPAAESTAPHEAGGRPGAVRAVPAERTVSEALAAPEVRHSGDEHSERDGRADTESSGPAYLHDPLVQPWLEVLIKGKPDAQARARTEIAMILESKGLDADAEDVYWTNVQARVSRRACRTAARTSG